MRAQARHSPAFHGHFMLVNCTAYGAGQRLRDLDLEEIPDTLADRSTFIWIGLKDPEPAEIMQMQTIFDLPELAVEDTLHGGQRPKLEEYEDERLLFVSMKVAESVEGGSGQQIHYGDLFVFVSERFVLSIRNGLQRGFSDVRARAEREPELLALGPAFILYALTDAVVDRFMPIVDQLEGELERVEATIFQAPPSRTTMATLHTLKQDVQELRHALPAVRDEPVFRIGGGPQAILVRNGLHEYFRDVHDHLQRINQSLDGLRDSVSMAMQVNLSLIGLEQSEVSKKLAAWAAIFAMMTTFAGIWGMNFEFMPELKWKAGYPLALLLMGGIGLLLYRRLRKAGWL